MNEFDATGRTALQSAARGAHWLVELFFTTGTIRYTTASVEVRSGSDTFMGGKAVDLSEAKESEDSGNDQIVLGFTVADVATLAAALGNVETYRGRPAKLWLQVFDEAWRPAGAKRLRFLGEMEPVRVVRQPPPPEGGAATGRIEMPLSRAGLPRARNADGLRLTHQQQLEEYPGDLGIEYTVSLLEKPALWLSKEFQRALVR